MSLNGKRDDFTLDDFSKCAQSTSMKRSRAEAIIREVTDAVVRWPEYAHDAGVDERSILRIGKTHRLDIAPR